MPRSVIDLSSKGPANSTAEKRDAAGNLLQIRFYDATGQALKNIDYGHDHTGVGDPHAHDWDWKNSPPRQPPRSLQPGE